MKKANLNMFQALDLVFGNMAVFSYDGYVLTNEKGNLYVRHLPDDRKKRLINHDELQLLKEKKFYVKDTDDLTPYTQNLFNT